MDTISIQLRHLLCFIFLIYSCFRESEGQGCFKAAYNPRHFNIGPGKYDADAMTSLECQQSCIRWSYAYAALGNGRYCLCSETDTEMDEDVSGTSCDVACTGGGGQCGSSSDHVNVHYSGPPIQLPWIILPDVTVFQVFEPINFGVRLVQYSDKYEYTWFWGDGSSDVVSSAQGGNETSHAYAIPGEYEIHVVIGDVNSLLTSHSAGISIAVGAPPDYPRMDCSYLLEYEVDEMVCNTSLPIASYSTVSVNFADGITENFHVADALWFATGKAFGQGSASASSGGICYVMPSAQFEYAGIVAAFEFYATATGDIEFLILRPECGANEYCYMTDTCVSPGTCGVPCVASTEHFCYRVDNQCGALDGTTGCSTASSDRVNGYSPTGRTYTAIKVFSHTIAATGYQVYRLNLTDVADDTEVLAGDIVGIQTSGTGRLATRTKDADEVDDLTNSAATIAEFTTTGTLSSGSTFRHYLRAVASRPSQVRINHMHRWPDWFNVSLTATSPDLPAPLPTSYIEREVIVQEKVDFLPFDTETHWITNYPFPIKLLPHKGSNLTFWWTYDYGYSMDVNTLGETSQTFLSRGIYQFNVTAGNLFGNWTNSTEVIIEDEILGLNATTGPAAVFYPHPITVWIGGGSDYEASIQWGDDQTDDYTELALTGILTSDGVDLTHTFLTSGRFNCLIVVRNNASSKTFPLEIDVGEAIEDLQFDKTGAMVDEPFVLEFSISAGNNVTFHNFTFDGVALTFDLETLTAHTGESVEEYNFSEVGVHTATIGAYNLVSNKYLTIDFVVERPVVCTGTWATISSTDIARYGSIVLSAFIEQGTSVEVTWDWGDGSSDVLSTDLGLDWKNRSNADKNVSREHPYSVPGVFNVTVTAKNNFNSIPQVFEVRVYQPVDNVTFTTNTPVPCLNFAGDFELQFQTPDDYPPTMPFMIMTYTINNTTRSLGSPLVMLMTYEHEFDCNLDQVIIDIHIWNFISDKVFTVNIELIAPVTNMMLRLDPEYAAIMVNYPVDVNAIVSMESGDGVTLCWDLDGVPGDEICRARSATTPNEEDVERWAYSSVGTYAVTVTATNIMGNTSITWILLVQRGVDEFAYITDSTPIQYPGSGSVTLDVTLTMNNGYYNPTDAFMTWVCEGDDRVEEPALISDPELTGNSETRSCTYPSPGVYYVTITIWNLASRVEFVVLTGAYADITSLTVTAMFTPEFPANSPPQQGLFSGNKRHFPIDLPVEFHFDAAGTVLEYSIESFSPNSDAECIESCQSSNEVISAKFDKVRSYIVHLKASNPFTEKTAILQLEVVERLSGLIITENGVITEPGDKKCIIIDFGTIGTVTCITVSPDADNEDTEWHYGEDGECGTDQTYQGPITQPLLICKIYGQSSKEISEESEESNVSRRRKRRSINSSDGSEENEILEFTIVVDAMNLFSNVTMTYTFIVMEDADCSIPDVGIVDRRPEIANPLVQEKNSAFQIASSDIKLVDSSAEKGLRCLTKHIHIHAVAIIIHQPESQMSASVELNCTSNYSNTKAWTIMQLSETTGEDIRLVDLSALPTRATSLLDVPARFLDYGLYRVTFSVSMLSTPVIGNDQSYLKIGRSPLVALTLSSGMTAITKGHDKDEVLNPRSISYDPDDEQGGVNFIMCCRREEEDYPDDWCISPDVHAYDYFTTPYTCPYETWQLDQIDSITDLGGCFRQGPGIIRDCDQSVDKNGVYEFNTGNMKINVTYVFDLFAYKDSRLSPAQLHVIIVDGSPPYVEITSLTEASARKTLGGLMVSPPSSVALTSNCLANCPENYTDMSFIWTLERAGLNGAFLKVSEVAAYVYHIPASVFKDDLVNYGAYHNYRIVLDVETAAGDKAVSYTELIINQPPSGGECSFSPTSVGALDDVTITCANWTDDLGETIHYAFLARVNALAGLESLNLIPDATYPNTWRTNLPAGDIEIVAEITDDSGSTTSVSLGTCNVVELSEEEYAQQVLSLSDNAEVAQVFAEGNHYDVMATISTYCGLADTVEQDSILALIEILGISVVGVNSLGVFEDNTGGNLAYNEITSTTQGPSLSGAASAYGGILPSVEDTEAYIQVMSDINGGGLVWLSEEDPGRGTEGSSSVVSGGDGSYSIVSSPTGISSVAVRFDTNGDGIVNDNDHLLLISPNSMTFAQLLDDGTVVELTVGDILSWDTSGLTTDQQAAFETKMKEYKEQQEAAVGFREEALVALQNTATIATPEGYIETAESLNSIISSGVTLQNQAAAMNVMESLTSGMAALVESEEATADDVMQFVDQILISVQALEESIAQAQQDMIPQDKESTLLSPKYFSDSDWNSSREDFGDNADNNLLIDETFGLLQMEQVAAMHTQMVEDVLRPLASMLSDVMVPGQPPYEFQVDENTVFSVTQTYTEELDTGQTITQGDGYSVTIGAGSLAQFSGEAGTAPTEVGVTLITMKNTYLGVPGGDDVEYVVDLTLIGEDGEPLTGPLDPPLSFSLPTGQTLNETLTAPGLPPQGTDQPSIYSIFYTINITESSQGVLLRVEPEDLSADIHYLVLIAFDRYPNYTVSNSSWDYDWFTIMPGCVGDQRECFCGGYFIESAECGAQPINTCDDSGSSSDSGSNSNSGSSEECSAEDSSEEDDEPETCSDMPGLDCVCDEAHRYTLVISNAVLGYRTGSLKIALRELSVEELENAREDCDTHRPPHPIATQEDIFTVNITTTVSTSACAYISYMEQNENGIWRSDGMWVSTESTQYETVCNSQHMTIFGGGFAVSPNTIDWAFVFANLDFFSNPTLYITEIVILVLYIMAVIWARHKDKKDKIKLGVTPMCDNHPNDKYLYEVLVYTGLRRNAGTKSNVKFIMSGDMDETEVRCLSDDKRSILQRGGIDAFLMATPRSLGALGYLRIWHDNNGKGRMASWFLKYLIVTDLQTKKRYYFIADRWLAVEEDDGQIDRLFPVAGKDAMTQFGYLFSHSTTKKINDDHLWFSVVARPPQSRFTRVQRVSCCLLLLFTSMLANAMFYEQAEEGSGGAFTIGPFALTMEQLYVGVISNLIVFPINFLCVWIFRKSRPRKKRPNRIREAIKRYKEKQKREKEEGDPDKELKATLKDDFFNEEESETGSLGHSRAAGTSWFNEQEMEPSPEEDSSMDRPLTSMSRNRTPSLTTLKEINDEGEDLSKKKKPFSLPWYFVIFGWIILWICTLVACFFVTMYGVQFGDLKCKKWITSMLLSFFTSVFLTQPIKVLLVAALLSLVWKNPNISEDESDEDEEEAELDKDEEFLHPPPSEESYEAAKPRAIGYAPPDPEALEKAREERFKELKMYDIFREIVFYLIFLWVVMVVCYNFRDPNAFVLRTNIKNTFVDQGLGSVDTFTNDFSKISKISSFWDWAEHTLIPGLLVGQWYNGNWLPGQRGFVADRASRIMGFATMRQLRVKPHSCTIVEAMRPLIYECRNHYSILDEEDRNFLPGWEDMSAPGTPNTTWPEYKYQNGMDLDSWPFWAVHALYNGGGYVLNMNGATNVLQDKLARLKQSGWIDSHTRAVFVEFTVYNAQVNLFAIVTMVAEMLSTGGVFPMFRVDSVNLLGYSADNALFEIFCQIVFVIFIIIFIVKEAKEFYRERRNYFQQFWNWVELGIIVISIGAIVLFFYRLWIITLLTGVFAESGGNAYMKFQYVGYWNELLLYTLGWLVFLSTVKFLKLLRFNRRMSLLAATLKDGAKALMMFGIIFAIIFCAYVQFFYLHYMVNLINFSSFVVSAETCLQMMLGRFDFYDMQKASPWLGPMFFFTYIVAIAYVLINMFVSILNESFASVREDISKQMNDHEMVDYIVNKFKNFTGMKKRKAGQDGKKPDDQENVQEILADTNYTIGMMAAAMKMEESKKMGSEMTEFPDKVDRLMSYISKVYFPDKEVLEMIALEKMSKKVRQQGMTSRQLEATLLGNGNTAFSYELQARAMKK